MHMKERETLELSIIIPCLNEENAIAQCVMDALVFLEKNQIQGEVLVVDNGSTDASMEKAFAHGARVVQELEKGYGSALCAGIAKSRGHLIIMGDGDDTYNFLDMDEMYQMLYEQRCDIVIGNRFVGDMEQGSMSWLHKWGIHMLSYFGRKRFRCDVYDFHCGMRGLTRQAAEQLTFHTKGMEFATEMIAEAAKSGLCIQQIPVLLRKSRYQRQSKLRTFRDGLRHLTYIMKG